MALTTFSTPGSVGDLSDRGRRAWSRDLGELFESQVTGNPSVPNDSPRPQFFTPLGVELEADATPKPLRWGAFPRKLARVPAPQRWQLGEERDRQEEYCEWSAERDRDGRIVRAFFTTEVPSYYHLLAADDPNRLLEVYREHVSPDVRRAVFAVPTDLQVVEVEAGRVVEGDRGMAYRERNPWNSLGAMHMVQGANTLPAAVVLVAQSTIVRVGS